MKPHHIQKLALEIAAACDSDEAKATSVRLAAVVGNSTSFPNCIMALLSMLLSSIQVAVDCEPDDAEKIAKTLCGSNVGELRELDRINEKARSLARAGMQRVNDIGTLADAMVLGIADWIRSNHDGAIDASVVSIAACSVAVDALTRTGMSQDDAKNVITAYMGMTSVHANPMRSADKAPAAPKAPTPRKGDYGAN